MATERELNCSWRKCYGNRCVSNCGICRDGGGGGGEEDGRGGGEYKHKETNRERERGR